MIITANRLCCLLVALAVIAVAAAQAPTPIPTLVAPTLVPSATEEAPLSGLPLRSAAADIAETDVFKVGILYNRPPYAEFTRQGELRGFDVDLARLIAGTWGSEIEFVQVTRENALEKLYREQVHAVASALAHYRDLDEALEFSQTYLIGRQVMMVRADSPHEILSAVSGQRIGYVIGTRTETALSLWRAQLNADLNLQYYLTLDRAFTALTGGEIDGLVAEEQALLRVSHEFSDRVRMLDEAVVSEPRAFALRRQDIAMRRLLNHTIQLLVNGGSLQRIHREYFPEADFPEASIALWDGIGEDVSPTQHSGELAFPARYALPQLLRAGTLRVGGIVAGDASESAGQAQLNALNAGLVQEFGRRWGVTVEMVSSDGDEAIELLRSGAVDLVAGLKPDWRLAPSLDFSAPYLLHGDRLMVPANARTSGFNDLRGRIIGVIEGDEGAQGRAQAWADSINASVRFFQTRPGGATLQLLEYNNVNAIYADSLLLLSHLQASPSALRLTERWYSRSYFAFGLPYNDVDFRLLVDYTIQELARDGTLARLSGPLILSDELPAFEITPGAAAVAGISLADA